MSHVFVSAFQMMAGIKAVSKIIPTKSSLPILPCLYMEFNGREFTVSGTDLERYMAVTFHSEIANPYTKIAINAKDALAMASGYKKDLDLIIIVDEDKLRISIQGAEASIRDQREFVPFNFRSLPSVFIDQQINILKFLKGHSFTKKAMSEDNDRPVLNSTFIEMNENRFCMTASNGFVIASYHTIPEAEVKSSMIVPRNVINVIADSLKVNRPISDVIRVIGRGEKVADRYGFYWMAETKGGPAYFSLDALTPGMTFPPYRSIRAQKWNYWFTFNREELLVKLEGWNKYEKIHNKPGVEVVIYHDRMTLSYIGEVPDPINGVEQESFIDIREVKVTGRSDQTNIKYACNINFFLDAVKAIDSEEITIFFNAWNTPIYISSGVNDPNTYLVMPMLLND